MTPRISRVTPLLLAILVVGIAEAAAQPMGTFRWQLRPYCNIVSLTVTRNAGVFALVGFDDQCGAAQRAGVTGAAFINPDGSVGLGLTTVVAPGGVPVHIDARIDVGSLGGTWRDSTGHDGTFAPTSGTSTGGTPRPPGTSNIPAGSITSAYIAPNAIGGAQIDASQVQARVTGTCPAGHYMRGINANGTVACEPLPGGDQSGLLIQTSFLFTLVPAASQPPGQLATLTFTAPVSGTAVLKSRGFCNLSPIAGTANTVTIASGISAVAAYAQSVSTWGAITVPSGSVSGIYHQGFTSEGRLTGMIAGTTYTVGLYGRHESGNVVNQCSGTFTVQLFTDVLP